MAGRVVILTLLISAGLFVNTDAVSSFEGVWDDISKLAGKVESGTIKIAEKLRTSYDSASLKNFHVLTVDKNRNVRESVQSAAKAEFFNNRRKRDSPPPPPGIVKYAVDLNDTHYQMIIHWAGADSKVIVALTRDITVIPETFTSQIYISDDYGEKFEKKSARIGSRNAQIQTFHNHPAENSHYIFVDVINKYLFTTTDFGKTLVSHQLAFTPHHMLMHPTNWRILAARDLTDNLNRLWLSRDFGVTWNVIRSNVKSFHWGVRPYDQDSALYIHSTVPNAVLLYRHDAIFSSPEELITDVVDFQLIDRFLIATRNATIRNTWDLELWVSHFQSDGMWGGRRSRFERASFPTTDLHQDYFIADAMESQIFVCANHNTTSSNLYISDSTGLRYSLSLENILYYDPTNPNNANSWLGQLSGPAFADLHSVDGLEGVYIATQLGNVRSLTDAFNSQQTVITYNKGGDWRHLTAPATDLMGQSTCRDSIMWWLFNLNCTLHLSQRFHTAVPSHSSRALQVLSRQSAIGLIIGTGSIGSSLDSNANYNIYRSNDGGMSWKEILPGIHLYTAGDHGSLLVAMLSAQLTAELLYSTDEGETWNTYVFSDEKMLVYGLLTEPGEKTTIFSIFGSKATTHSWVVIQVNLRSVLGRECGDSDYKDWSPTDNPNVNCLMGKQVVYRRRIAGITCYNGQDFIRPTTVRICPCSLDDYECDYGFRINSTDDIEAGCEYDTEANLPVYEPPADCREGQTYNRTRGYRRIPGDVCEEGLSYRYDPVETACPIRSGEEFLLYTNRTLIHRYMFDRARSVNIPVSTASRNILTLEYDQANDCMFWTDGRWSSIMTMCLRGPNVTQHTLIHYNSDAGIDTIEGLAYNWMSHQLFWVDAGRRRIETARVDGSHRKVIVNSSLDQPRAIAVYPQKGYLFWSDWSATYPRVVRADMDGRSARVIVDNNGTTRWVHWPNGLAIDDSSTLARIYITDAEVDHIFHCAIDGSDRRVVIRQSSYVLHPYAISIFKDEMYWTDWTLEAIMVANKYSGNGTMALISGLPGIMDLKVIHRNSQQGSGPCSVNNGGCVSLCFEVPGATALLGGSTVARCACADMFDERIESDGRVSCLCRDGQAADALGNCPTPHGNATCSGGRLACRNGRCVPMAYKCDGDNDCGDGTDEENCPKRSCGSGQFACDNGRCIIDRWVCDRDNDCGDMSDERVANCTFPTCSSTQFECDNGRCISANWRCDLDDDCHDGSDERNCNITTTLPPTVTCTTSQFRCASMRLCIPGTWVCDGTADCPDASDESRCSSTSPTTCAPGEFRCNDGTCLPGWQRCDRRANCLHGEDEFNCTYTTLPTTTEGVHNHTCYDSEMACDDGSHVCIARDQYCDGILDCPSGMDESYCLDVCSRQSQFRCNSGQCLPQFMRCDGHADCTDRSDEMNCPVSTTRRPWCGDEMYQCESGDCIFQSWVCDAEPDCPAGDDELHCNNGSAQCTSSQFHCFYVGGCVDNRLLCNGIKDCVDGTDELGCGTIVPPTLQPCAAHMFTCGDGECIPARYVCDSRYDCRDQSDEFNCSVAFGYRAMFWAFVPETDTPEIPEIRVTVYRIVPNIESGTTGTLKATIKKTSDPSKVVQVIPSALSASTEFPLHITFSALDPSTEYSVAVLIEGMPTAAIDPVTVSTKLTAPGAPTEVKAEVVVNGTDIGLKVSWQPPKVVYGNIKNYTVYYEDIEEVGLPGRRPRSHTVPGSELNTIIRRLRQGQIYYIQVSAFNGIEGALSLALRVPLVLPAGCVKLLDAVANQNATSKADVKHLKADTADGAYGQYIVVSWSVIGDKADDISMYTVHASGRDIWDFKNWTVECKKAKEVPCSAEISGLNPSTLYTISVMAEFEGVSVHQCPESKNIDVTTRGMRFTPPLISLVRLNPNNNDASVTYSVYGAKAEDDVVLRVYYMQEHVQSNNSIHEKDFSVKNSEPIVITDLVACDTYQFSPQLIKPLRTSWGNSVIVQTHKVANAPPKNVRTEHKNEMDTTTDIEVLWDPPCEPEKATYIITVKDTLLDKEQGVSVEASGKELGSLTHTILKVPRGAHYCISIAKNQPGAESSRPHCTTIRPYPAPLDFKVVSHADTESKHMVYELSWTRPSEPDPAKYTLKYDIFHAEGDINFNHDRGGRIWLHNLTYSLFKTTEKTELMTLDTFDPAVDHAFKIRVAAVNGYPGHNTTAQTAHALSKAELDAISTGSSQDSSKYLIPGIAVGVVSVLLIIIGVLVIRHQRLQRSFTSYASSHYDRRSNSATFNDLEEEDQPMINAFADDEPLIIG